MKYNKTKDRIIFKFIYSLNETLNQLKNCYQNYMVSNVRPGFKLAVEDLFIDFIGISKET